MTRFYTTTTGEQLVLPDTRPHPDAPPRIWELEATLRDIDADLEALLTERAALRQRRRQLQHDLRAARDRADFAQFQRKQEMN